MAAPREASRDRDLDLLGILAIAFDPRVLSTDEDCVASDESFDVAGMRSLGRIPVLLVRMNADLLMGEELKKTGAGNLFTPLLKPSTGKIAVKVINDYAEPVEVQRGIGFHLPPTLVSINITAPGRFASESGIEVASWTACRA